MNTPKYIAYLTIVRYPAWAIPFALLSMGLFRLPLWLTKNIHFYKLMGSGRNGSFDKTPDWRQWAVLTVSSQIPPPQNTFIHQYWKFFRCTTTNFVLEPIEGHGLWDGKEVFGALPKQTDYDGPIAVLTRATIRLSKLQRFWSHVDGIAKPMANADGFITSYGIGEIPFIKQATFSLWQSKKHMKDFAYKMKEHAEVVSKTRKENWYSEEMFTRFKVLSQQKHICKFKSQ